jgi:hypothetical protein
LWQMLTPFKQFSDRLQTPPASVSTPQAKAR